MSPAEKVAADAVRTALQNAQSAVWRNDIDRAIRILFDALVPELRSAPLSALHRVIELSRVITRAANEQLVSTMPQSLKKLLLNDVEKPTLSDNVLVAQILDEDAYTYADQFVSAPNEAELGPSRGTYRPNYETIDTLFRHLRITALLGERSEFFGLTSEELAVVLKRVEPVLAAADPRAFANSRDDASLSN